jgi:hypothetical protein
MSESVSKSWFCVFNNPAEHNYPGEPRDVVERVIADWCEDEPTRTCAVAYASLRMVCIIFIASLKMLRLCASQR